MCLATGGQMYSLDAVESELLSALWDGLFEIYANAVQHVRFLLYIGACWHRDDLDSVLQRQYPKMVP